MIDEKTTSLGLYRAMFRYMLANGNARLIHNDSKDHACVLIEELLRFAKKDIRIFCRNLGADVWENAGVLSALGDALARDVSVQVVLQAAPEDGAENRALSLLRSRNVDVRKTNNTGVSANFIVVDEKAYRLEKDVENRRGYACANDSDNARKLAGVFENLKADSDEVATPGEAEK